jgi:hypothetical protein
MTTVTATLFDVFARGGVDKVVIKFMHNTLEGYAHINITATKEGKSVDLKDVLSEDDFQYFDKNCDIWQAVVDGTTVVALEWLPGMVIFDVPARKFRLEANTHVVREMTCEWNVDSDIYDHTNPSISFNPPGRLKSKWEEDYPLITEREGN